MREVYPRLRGGSRIVAGYAVALAGLSPPTRGIHGMPPNSARSCRSIPAYAGDPGWRISALIASAVYPRLRGGSECPIRLAQRAHGLSPPTRGIPLLSLAAAVAIRSIPAYAGDPELRRPSAKLTAVYPRLRGGSTYSLKRRVCQCGLSPPTRGIHYLAARRRARFRSIPAYAGDPTLSRCVIRRRMVYPRLRGGSL